MSGLTANNVVVPVDFSDESIAAVDTALEITGDASKVHVVHVLPELNAADPGFVWQTVDEEVRSHHAAQALRERLAADRYALLDIHVETGDPGHRVANFAENSECDLIVVPSHGRRGLSRMLIGSVAERIIRLAHCPVLVLRN